MNQIDTTDNSLEVIENFLLLTATPGRLLIVKNLLSVIEEFEIDTDIISDMKEEILKTEDVDIINFEINKILFDISIEILNSHGINVIIKEISLSTITNILSLIIEVPKYNMLTYQSITSVLMSEEDNIIKLNNLLTISFNTSSNILFEYVDSVTTTFITNLEKGLEQSKEVENEVNEDYLEFITKVSTIYQPLLNTQLVKKMIEDEDFHLEYDEQISSVYTFIEKYHLFDVDKSALELVSILLLSIGIENVYYVIDGEVRDDMIELGYNIDVINNIIAKAKDIMSRMAKYD
jgi:hypothetical protein